MNSALFGAQRSLIREFSALAKSVPGCIALTLGEPESDTPVPIRDAAHAALEAGETHYIGNNGVKALREKIAAFERENNGLPYDAKDIMVTVGATEAIFTMVSTSPMPSRNIGCSASSQPSVCSRSSS